MNECYLELSVASAASRNEVPLILFRGMGVSGLNFFDILDCVKRSRF